MRYPRTFKLLIWASPTLVVAGIGFVGLIAALSPTYPGVKQWSQEWFEVLSPVLLTPQALFLAGLALAFYAFALIWTSQPRLNGDLARPLDEPDHFRAAANNRKEEALTDALFGRRDKRSATGQYFDDMGRATKRAEATAGRPESVAHVTYSGLVEAKDIPHQDHTAIRIKIRNQSEQNLQGLVARLVETEPPLAGIEGAIELPLVLEPQDRLDRLRNPAIQEQLPQTGFDLHARSEKQIEVVWLHSKGALEGYITHEAGEANFLFMGSIDFHIEVSGAGVPISAVVRINVADDDIQSWTVSFIPKGVAQADG